MTLEDTKLTAMLRTRSSRHGDHIFRAPVSPTTGASEAAFKANFKAPRTWARVDPLTQLLGDLLAPMLRGTSDYLVDRRKWVPRAEGKEVQARVEVLAPILLEIPWSCGVIASMISILSRDGERTH